MTTAAVARVLIVDDERDLAESCAFFLGRAGFAAATAFSAEDALGRLETESYDLVVTDLKMPRMSGLMLLDAVKRRDPGIEVVVITGYPEIETAVEAMRRGAIDYVQKPFTEEELLQRVHKAVAHRALRAGNRELEQRLARGAAGREIVHCSSALAATLATLERAARTDASVLILGESGTGKELLAHRLHDASPRAERPFVPVDCAAMAENLVESELFGHVKGSFSGATANKMGLFQLADRGTLFLDEIGEIPLPLQTKLLRAIQEKQIRRVGDGDLIEVDVRIVCATNRDIDAEVAAGRFREDLLYRLDVLRVVVPPLRDRLEDVEPIARHALAEFVEANPNSAVTDFDDDALVALRAYPWPGNVRQLRNAIERAATLGAGPLLRREDLPAEVRGAAEGADLAAAAGESFQEMKARKVAAIESAYLESLLRRHGGNVTRCAEESGMARSAFQKLMQRYGIKSSDFRG